MARVDHSLVELNDPESDHTVRIEESEAEEVPDVFSASDGHLFAPVSSRHNQNRWLGRCMWLVLAMVGLSGIVVLVAHSMLSDTTAPRTRGIFDQPWTREAFDQKDAQPEQQALYKAAATQAIAQIAQYQHPQIAQSHTNTLTQ